MGVVVGAGLASRYEFRKLALATDKSIGNRGIRPPISTFQYISSAGPLRTRFLPRFWPSWCQSHMQNTIVSRFRRLNGQPKNADFAEV
jgi:hypothetical protein